MAPTITAVELMFNPTEATIMEQIKIQTLYPLKVIPSFVVLIISGISCLSLFKESVDLIKPQVPEIKTVGFFSM